jgi:catechol 2,3-dioxygenase-like lactoylglutathione lyase family enzyme
VSRAPALHHAAVRCRDLARAERFYAGVLGLPVLRRWPRAAADGGGDRSVWLALGGGGFLALERADGGGEGGRAGGDAGPGAGAVAAGEPVAIGGADLPFDAAPPGWHVVALSMERADRSSWEARLAAAGVAVERRTPFSIFFRDPEGNRLALSHWPDEAAAEGA